MHSFIELSQKNIQAFSEKNFLNEWVKTTYGTAVSACFYTVSDAKETKSFRKEIVIAV